MLKIIFSVIARDLQLAMRRQADIVSALFFFVIVVSLFPLGIGPETDLLRKLAHFCEFGALGCELSLLFLLRSGPGLQSGCNSAFAALPSVSTDLRMSFPHPPALIRKQFP